MDQAKTIEDKLKLENQFKGGAGWFYWIAGLSLINSVINLVGAKWGFVVGLGVTQFVDAVAANAGMVGKAFGFALNLVIAGMVFLFGVMANKRQSWAFIVGMALYALDALLYLLAKDILGFGFHCFALFFIFRGFQAMGKLATLEKQAAVGVPPSVPTPRE